GLALRRLPRARPSTLRSATPRRLAGERGASRDAPARRRHPHARVPVGGVLPRLSPVRRRRYLAERQAPREHVSRVGGEPFRARARSVPGLPHARPPPPL